MLSNAGLTRTFWAEAVSIACYLINRGPYTGIQLKTPYVVWSGKSAEEKEYMSRVPYASAVGRLMYAMVCTRPYLAHTVSVVSRYMGDPSKEHWKAMKRISPYLRGTSDVGLIYGGDTQCLVTGYSNSDYAGDVDSRRSIDRLCFYSW